MMPNNMILFFFCISDYQPHQILVRVEWISTSVCGPPSVYVGFECGVISSISDLRVPHFEEVHQLLMEVLWNSHLSVPHYEVQAVFIVLD